MCYIAKQILYSSIKNNKGVIIPAWLKRVVNYFKFVGNRRVTTRYGVLPEVKIFLAVCISIFLAILLAYHFLDPAFFEWKKEGLYGPDSWFRRTTDIGRSEWWLIVTGVIVLLMSIYSLDNRSAPYRVIWQNLFLKFYFAFTAIAFSGLIAIALKNIFGRARPHMYEGNSLWKVVLFEDTYNYASFPSGHSTTIGAIAAIVFLLLPKFRWFFIALALWVGASRVAVGAHFPSDVIAGLSLGAGFTWLYARSFARKRLLFEFDQNGAMRMRNQSVKRAIVKIREGKGKPILPSLPDQIITKAAI